MSAGSTQDYWISYSASGVLIGRNTPEAAEPFRQRLASIEISEFEDQLLGEGYAVPDAAGTQVPWDSVYSLLSDANYASSMHLLALPPETPTTLRLTSEGSLTDANFQIRIAGGIDENRNPVAFGGLRGGVVQIGRDLTLLSQPAWRLADLVGTFYRRPPAERNEGRHRRQWGVIRRAAVQANAEMSDFLRRTVVLTPEKLQIKLRKAQVGETKVVEVTPSFEGAPAGWLNTFDNSSRISERYDISTANGVVQILTTPEIRSVLGEIKRFHGRRITGERAEAFLLNPFSALGSDAVKVLDEDQFAEAKSEAGIAYERFRPHIIRNVVGYPSEVGIDIDQADGSGEQRLFQNDAEFAEFVDGLERRLTRGLQIYGWQGYEFELWGDAEGALTQLRAALDERQKLRIDISRDQVYDLNQYSERIAEIGQDKRYISTYIVKRADEGGWFPANLLVCLSLPGREDLIPMSPEQFDRWDQDIDAAEARGQATINLPGTSEMVAVADARMAADRVKGPLHASEPPAKPFEHEPKAEKPIGKPPTLIIRANIAALEHPEHAEPVAPSPPSQMERPAALRQEVELRAHQVEGIARMQLLFAQSPDKCRGVLLADDMGLGKTIQLLTLIAWCAEKFPNIPPALVVAPVSLLENWQRERDLFFHPGSLPIMTAYGDCLTPWRVPREHIDTDLRSEGLIRFLQPDWRGNARIVLTTYETLRDLEFSFAKERWSIMICDEAQKIKNPNAMVTRAAKKQNVRFRIACTGTPVENSLADLWCLYDFVQPGFLGALNDFGKDYGRPIEEMQVHGAEKLSELRARIEPLLIRRTKKDVAKDLPRKIEVADCRVPMLPEQREYYTAAFQGVGRATCAGEGSKKGQHLGILQRLRLICADPRPYGVETFVPEDLRSYRLKASKMDWLLTQLDHIRSLDEKALIFAENRDIQRLLKHYIRDHFVYDADIVNGDTAVSSKAEASRQKKIDQFQAAPGFGAIILSPLAVGFGVNIQAANHVIHFLRHWNPAKEDQATDRAYRIGAKKDVYVYCPLTVAGDFKTFDVKLDELLRRKRGLATDTLMGYGQLAEEELDIRDILPPDLVIRDRQITPERLSAIDCDFFEKLVAKLWRLQGYDQVRKTPRSGDGGIDVVAIWGMEGALIQCKSSAKEGNALRWDAIKDVVTGANMYRRRHPGVQFKLVCITNQTFNAGAREQAGANNVELVERDGLAHLLLRYPVSELDINL